MAIRLCRQLVRQSSQAWSRIQRSLHRRNPNSASLAIALVKSAGRPCHCPSSTPPFPIRCQSARRIDCACVIFDSVSASELVAFVPSRAGVIDVLPEIFRAATLSRLSSGKEDGMNRCSVSSGQYASRNRACILNSLAALRGLEVENIPALTK